MIQRTIQTFYRKQVEYLKPTLPVPILFTHVPKCAGTSIDKAFRDNFRIRGTRPDFEMLRRANIALTGQGSIADFGESATLLLLYAAQQGSTYLSGHFPINENALKYLKSLNPFFCITLLREPYSRLQSNYIYRKVRLWMLKYETAPNLENQGEEKFIIHQREELLKFYDSKEGRFQLSLYANMFGNGSYQEAKSTLKCFDVVGVVKHMNLFTNKLSSHLQQEFKVEHINKIDDKSYQNEARLLKLLFQDKLIEADIKTRLVNENDLYSWVLDNLI
ncbi:hypothetical protein VB713_21400 [Anabaena cylindrica UHCC 0172]|uniref:hypothetical protein n=1 Tax=Anabaena cylindrica TaxID=1165 RepID=UPI002B207699|nr:hypothetical protein [Anabaena cylindrica]MEA5553499.1 hypothetical protein [Anabaena cylindrica UHCC 0172]